MQYPELIIPATSRDNIDVFGGYNHNVRIGDSEFYDMKNLSSSNYPAISPRKPRGEYEIKTTNVKGMISKYTSSAYVNIQTGTIIDNPLSYVDGNKFIIAGFKEIDLGLNDSPKDLISMGAYVIIMPDKKYVNITDIEDYGDIEATVTTTTDVKFSLCNLDGNKYDNITINDKAPSEPKNLDLWLNTASEPNTLYQYSSANEQWVAVAATYIKISAMGIGKPFEVDDGVTISGIEDDALSDLNNTMIVNARGDDYIVVTGILDKVITQPKSKPITIKRTMPDMHFIIESGNRLWGCYYGKNDKGEFVNEIYASKLGDFKNWNCFAGVSTDSYAATVGTDGLFTGAISYMGYPLFFKENCIHKVYGNYPANYQIQTTPCTGVQSGSSKSLAIVNEVLYYKSRSSVCAYDGTFPTEISTELGDVYYSNAVAGGLKGKYYISMLDENKEYQLFVYDTKKRMWHKEDNVQAMQFCSHEGELYYIDAADQKIKNVVGSGVTADTAKVNWMAETGIMGISNPDKKYISRIDVRMSLKFGSRVTFFIDYDSAGSWEHIYTMDGVDTRSFTIPIKPKRCDHFRLRIEGVGDAKIYSICKTIEQGSEV